MEGEGREEITKSSLDASKRWGSRCVDEIYEKEMCVGEGTYGQVFRAHSRAKKDEIVALKRIRMDNEKEGFPITAIREIKLLKQLKHKNILELKEIVTDSSDTGIYMVFEFMDHDLSGLLEAGHMFKVETIKCYMKQLLEGLHFCHKNKVLHRDIKASNLLIDNKGRLKLADFGLARSQHKDAKYTNRVITRWYRPPELLLGSTSYGPEVDMWSVGCIFYELIMRRPLFPGKDDIDQIDKIFSVCGTPTKQTWPQCFELPLNKYIPRENDSGGGTFYTRTLKDKCSRNIDEIALDLLDKMLTYEPSKRISAHNALNHKYFWTDPLPANPADIQPYDRSCHDYSVKRKRRAINNSNNTNNNVNSNVNNNMNNTMNNNHNNSQQPTHHNHQQPFATAQHATARNTVGPNVTAATTTAAVPTTASTTTMPIVPHPPPPLPLPFPLLPLQQQLYPYPHVGSGLPPPFPPLHHQQQQQQQQQQPYGHHQYRPFK